MAEGSEGVDLLIGPRRVDLGAEVRAQQGQVIEAGDTIIGRAETALPMEDVCRRASAAGWLVTRTKRDQWDRLQEVECQRPRLDRDGAIDELLIIEKRDRRAVLHFSKA